jgi:hypothetical protein
MPLFSPASTPMHCAKKGHFNCKIMSFKSHYL